MKKQILFMSFGILLVLFISINKSYGQYSPNITLPENTDIHCPTATPIEATCVSAGPLSPVPGTLYTYTVAVSDAGNSTIHWFVTTNATFITNGILTTDIQNVGGTYITSAGTVNGNATYNDGENKIQTIDITWKSFDPAQNVFLVTYAETSSGCTDNVQVYKIVPVHAFTLDLVALNNNGQFNNTRSDCVSPVQEAIYNPISGEVEMDYGVNYIYFAVNAANFSHSWKPTFQVTSDMVIANGNTLAVHWAYPNDAVTGTWKNTTVGRGDDSNIYTANDAVLPSGGASGVGSLGECIIVRLTVDHNKNETLAAITFNFAVDGIMYDPATDAYTTAKLGDLHTTSGSTSPAQDCPWVDGYANDKLTYTLTPRPSVQATDPQPFLPKN